MSRFQISLAVAIIAAIAAAIGLSGSTRIAAIGAIVTAEILLFSAGMASMQLQFFCPAICHGRTGEQRVALTFDDGPDPASTPALLDLLARENIHATFFCIGKHVAAHPEIARRISAEGHLLGNHSFLHSWLTSFNRGRGLERELTLCQNAIRDATSITPVYYRPPMGLTNPHYRYALKQTSLTLIGWNVRPRDTMRSASAVIEHVLRDTSDGSIILLHDGGTSAERIVEIVSAVVKVLRSRGLSFERVDRMI